MTCMESVDRSRACCGIEDFGRRLGMALADPIKSRGQAEARLDLAAYAIECVLETASVRFAVERSCAAVRSVLDECLLYLALSAPG
jgi:hypothetical protein